MRFKISRNQLIKRFVAIILTFAIGVSANFVYVLFAPIHEETVQVVYKVEIYQPVNSDIETCGLFPLILLVTLDANQQLSLNITKIDNYSEEFGDWSLSKKVESLSAKLEMIFDNRTRNGAYKVGTNEIEKTIIVKVDKSVSYQDLIILVDGLKGAGANPIQLNIDGCLETVRGKCENGNGF